MIYIARFLTVALVFFFCFSSCSRSTASRPPLVVYCGAGLHKAASQIGELYEKKYAVPIHYNFAGSNTLLSQLQLVKNADIYIPASAYYLKSPPTKNWWKRKPKLHSTSR